MNYKVFLILVKAICIPCVYILSYYCFSKTNLFTLLNSLFSSNTQALLIITFFFALFFLLINIIKGDANGFVFLICTSLCLAAAAGFSKMNWITVLIYYIAHMQITFQTYMPAEKVSVICILIVSGCIIIWLVSKWGKEYDSLISGGTSKSDASKAFISQTFYFLLSLITAWFFTAVFYLVLIYFDEWFKKSAVSTNISPAFLALIGILPFLALLYIYLGSLFKNRKKPNMNNQGPLKSHK